MRYLLIFSLLVGIGFGVDRPNVLCISIDDLNDWVGYLGGHSQVKTPHMDKLVKRGVAFSNAHCSTPICKPSRTAILTGLSAAKTGVYSNGDKFDFDDYILISQHFEKNGYITYGSGKVHHVKKNERFFMNHFNPEQRWSPFDKKAVNYTKKELASKGTSNPRHEVKDGPGGKDYLMPFNRMPSDRYPKKASGESFDWHAFELGDEAFGDGQVTQWSIEKLKAHDASKPFFMTVGYYRPHIPLYAPKKYFDLYPLDTLQLPEIMNDDLDDVPERGRERALDAVTAGKHSTVIKYGQWKQAVQAYLACVSFIDSQIGELMAYLETSHYAKNTIIVLYSDHGWHLGEKQAWGKSTGWAHSTRVPFMIVRPGENDSWISDEAVSLLDIYPTLIDLCDLPKRKLDGISLLPLLNNKDLVTDRIVCTWVNKDDYALISKQWHLIHYKDGEQELYHRQKDPRQYTNLAKNPEYRSVIAKLKQALK